MAKPAILILSAGSGVGRCIVLALEISGTRNRYRLIAANSDPNAGALFRCDAAHLVPEAAQDGSHRESLRGVLRAETPAVVLAGRDSDLIDMAALKVEPEFAHILFLSPDAAAVRVVNDKYASWQLAAAHGLPFAETARSHAELDSLIARVGFPLIAKPADGFGGRNVHVVRTAAEADAALATDRFVFQPFLGNTAELMRQIMHPEWGVPLSHDFYEFGKVSGQCLVGRGGRMLTFAATGQVIRSGIGLREWPVTAPTLETAAAGFARALGALGYIGPLNFNCAQVGPDEYCVYEMNGRFTGATASRTALGFREVDYALEHFLEGRMPPPFTWAIPPAMTDRAPGVMLIDGQDLATLTRHGVWRRPPH